MDSEECKHSTTVDNVCTNCGLCFEGQIFQSEWSPATTSFVPQHLLRYSVEDKIKMYDRCALKIMVPLGLGGYKQQVTSLLTELKFGSRLKTEDKIIVILYHLLKLHSFPISLADLLIYTGLTKYQVLKEHRDLFSFQEASEEYLKGIYERTISFLLKINCTASCDFDSYCVLQRKFLTAEPKAFCLAYILEVSHQPSRIINNSQDYKIQQIKNMRRKIKKELRAESNIGT